LKANIDNPEFSGTVKIPPIKSDNKKGEPQIVLIDADGNLQKSDKSFSEMKSTDTEVYQIAVQNRANIGGNTTEL